MHILLVDEAFKNRVDLHYYISSLSEPAIYKITTDMLKELIDKNIIINDSIILPSYQIAKLSNNYNNGCIEHLLLTLTTKLKEASINGRDLRRLPFRVMSAFSMINTFKEINLVDFIKKAFELIQEQLNKQVILI